MAFLKNFIRKSVNGIFILVKLHSYTRKVTTNVFLEIYKKFHSVKLILTNSSVLFIYTVIKKCCRYIEQRDIVSTINLKHCYLRITQY